MSFLNPNIGTRGRLVRALSGVAFLGVAIFAWSVSPWLGAGIGISGLFMIFEAARGWCILRACGVKTRM
ncbi:MAG TPA: DUF2892 domain-containing protein [Verrucomicrobiae bacterium]|nr:DUF2892 domain-containing protein [Verrucomicrobiae bacterium]